MSKETAYLNAVFDATAETSSYKGFRNVPSETDLKQSTAGASSSDELTVEQLQSLVGERETENFARRIVFRSDRSTDSLKNLGFRLTTYTHECRQEAGAVPGTFTVDRPS